MLSRLWIVRVYGISFFLCIHYFSVSFLWAESEKAVTIDYQGRPQKVTYSFYMPPVSPYEKIPVLVCVGGLPMQGDQYLRSDTMECLDPVWKKFADENHIAILGLGFLFIAQDWLTKSSYQYPKAWSGQALLDILTILSREATINPQALYLFGISAGAQFSVRFAQMNPHLVQAVSAHAAGGYDLPPEYIPTKFLITVGREDNKEITRREMAKVFARACRSKRIDLSLKIISGIAHRQTEEQNQMSREFFRRILMQSRNKISNFSPKDFCGWLQ